jgi:signal transduction histidine kinase
MSSIRGRITLVASCVMLVVLTAVGFVLLRVQRSALTASLDETVTERVDGIERLVREDRLPAELSGLGDDDTLAQVVRDGRVTAASTNIAGQAPLAVEQPGRIYTVGRLPTDDTRFRVLGRQVSSPEGATTIVVAASLDDVDESLRVLRRSLLVVVPLVTGVFGALVWCLVGRTLHPVEAIRRDVDAIGELDLDRRVVVPATGDEIARLAATMNAMLARLQTADERQRRFVADAAHELRSPLARMRAELEVELATHPADGAARPALSSTLEEVVQLSTLVEDLLGLARAEAVRPSAVNLVELDEVVTDAARGRAVTVTALEPVTVHGDAAGLRRAVSNLLENATRHAVTTVSISLVVQAERARLTVADDGPGIPVGDRERVFERFARLDESRTTATGGAGLGLAIVRAVVASHGGVMGIADPPGGQGTVVWLELPVAVTGARRTP